MHYIDCMHDFDWCATRSKRVENTVKAQWTRGHVLNSGQLRRPDGSSGGFYARCVPRLVLSSRLDPRVRLRSATKSSALHLELFDVHEHSLAHILCGRSRRRSLPISLTALPDVSQIAFLPHGHQNPSLPYLAAREREQTIAGERRCAAWSRWV